MSDSFDEFLARSLAPGKREPDRAFVARVAARIRLEESFAAERAAVRSRLIFELAGLAAVAVSVAVLASSPQIAALAEESPEIMFAGLLAAFAFVVATFGAVAPSPRRNSGI